MQNAPGPLACDVKEGARFFGTGFGGNEVGSTFGRGLGRALFPGSELGLAPRGL